MVKFFSCAQNSLEILGEILPTNVKNRKRLLNYCRDLDGVPPSQSKRDMAGYINQVKNVYLYEDISTLIFKRSFKGL